MRVRVFGGFDYVEEDLYRSDFARHGYANGVPMGGDLTAAADGKAPSLLIAALRDPAMVLISIACKWSRGWTNPDGSAGGASLWMWPGQVTGKKTLRVKCRR